jgi:hypothetical protein
MQYSLGDLNCVVQFEVDACYLENRDAINEPTDLDGAQLNSLSLSIDQLSIDGPMEDKTTGDLVSKSSTQIREMSQSTAAELKSKGKPTSLNTYMPQLWFGRTPWLIIGYHNQGTVHEVKVVHAADRFVDWESKHQIGLRKLTTVLSRLREAVEKNKSMNCSAICLKGSSVREITVYPAALQRQPLTDDFVKKF